MKNYHRNLQSGVAFCLCLVAVRKRIYGLRQTQNAPNPLWYNKTMNEKESRISKENRMLRKANWELDDENKELKARVEELEGENRKLRDYSNSLKNELLKVMVENEELKRRN